MATVVLRVLQTTMSSDNRFIIKTIELTGESTGDVGSEEDQQKGKDLVEMLFDIEMTLNLNPRLRAHVNIL
jgi:hypothetical protein